MRVIVGVPLAAAAVGGAIGAITPKAEQFDRAPSWAAPAVLAGGIAFAGANAASFGPRLLDVLNPIGAGAVAFGGMAGYLLAQQLRD